MAQETAGKKVAPWVEKRAELPVSQSAKTKEACSADCSVANLAAKKAEPRAAEKGTSSAAPMVVQMAGETADSKAALRAGKMAGR